MRTGTSIAWLEVDSRMGYPEVIKLKTLEAKPCGGL